VIEEKCPGLVRRLRSFLDGVKTDCPDTASSVRHARKIFRELKSYFIPKPVQSEQHAQNDKEETTEGTQTQPAACVKGTSIANDAGPKRNDPNVNSILDNLLGKKPEDLPRSFDGLMESELFQAVSQSQVGRITVAVPTPTDLGELTEETLAEARKATLALRCHLQGLLQSLVVKRSMIGLCGHLETNKVHKIFLNSPKVFRRNGLRRGLDVAVHLLLDASGSMFGLIGFASATVYSICEALAAVPGIKVAVTAFPGDTVKKQGNPDHRCPTVAPVLRFGQRPHRRFNVKAAGNTPLAESLWWVTQEMALLRESRKMIIVVTDGEPDSLDETRLAIKAAESVGIEIYGLGLNDSTINDLLLGRCVVIHNLMEMPRKLFGLLGKTLGRNRKGAETR
jgi:hypothetical protein